MSNTRKVTSMVMYVRLVVESKHRYPFFVGHTPRIDIGLRMDLTQFIDSYEGEQKQQSQKFREESSKQQVMGHD